MKARSAALQGALAIIGLTAAYFTWQRPPEKTDGEVVVLDVSRSELRTLKFEDERRVVEVFSEAGAVWIRQTEKPPPPPGRRPKPKPPARARTRGPRWRQ